MRLLLFNKPFRCLSQFTDSEGRPTLAQWIAEKNVYPAGRLDFDSEGLLILTDDGALQARISDPKYKLRKTYRVQVEGESSADAMSRLRSGVIVKGERVSAIAASPISRPHDLWPRQPPVRYRKSVPDHWLEIVIDRGLNRQIRRMTAAVGLPALRLIRQSIGPWSLGNIQPGEWLEIPERQLKNEIRKLGWSPIGNFFR
jgi:23S rRNA pseudouridine2457 synthase